MSAFTVALIGADGAGKSTIAARVVEALEIPAVALYMGDNPEAGGAVLPTSRWLWRRRAKAGAGPTHGAPAPPGQRTRSGMARRLAGAPRTVLLLLNQMAEEWWRWRTVRREVRRGRVVVLDRSWLHDYWFYDIAAPDRSLPQRVHGWWLQRALGLPDLAVCLDAPPEVLYARKPEGSIENLRVRREQYLAMADLTTAFHVIDVSSPLDEVIGELQGLITDHARSR